MIFGINHEYLKLDDHLESTYGDLDSHIIWPYSRVSMMKHDLVEFWIKYVHLDQIRWIVDVGYVIGLNIEVLWILPKLVNYGKSHLWLWEVVWINYVSKWVYESILSVM